MQLGSSSVASSQRLEDVARLSRPRPTRICALAIATVALSALGGCQFDVTGLGWSEADGGGDSGSPPDTSQTPDASLIPDSTGNADSAVADSAVPDAHSDSCGDGILDPVEACDDGNTSPADGVSDFCAADCMTESWPCGDWPGYVAPSNSTDWAELTDTTVGNSASGYAAISAGSQFSIAGTYDYDPEASGCPSCRVQLYWGLYAGEPPASNDDAWAGEWQICVDYVNVYDHDDYDFDLHAPTQTGTYYLRWDRSWQYGCIAMGIPSETRTLAAICVQ